MKRRKGQAVLIWIFAGQMIVRIHANLWTKWVISFHSGFFGPMNLRKEKKLSTFMN